MPRKAGQEAAEFLDRVREGSGIFVELGPDLYGFAHRTFLEYFLAKELTRSRAGFRKELSRRLHQPRWREPILLAIGLICQQSPDDIPEILSIVLSHPGPYEEILQRNILFAADCLVECGSRYASPATSVADTLLRISSDPWGRGQFATLRARARKALLRLCEAGYAQAVMSAADERLARAPGLKEQVALVDVLAELPVTCSRNEWWASAATYPLLARNVRVLEAKSRSAARNGWTRGSCRCEVHRIMLVL